MSKHKTGKRKIYIAEFPGLVLGSTLIAKCHSKEEMEKLCYKKMDEMCISSKFLHYMNIKEIKHSQNEIFFWNGDY